MLYLRQEVCSDGCQSLLGPGCEPVDGHVVHQAREVPAAVLEGVARGRHAEDNVEVVGALLDEVGPARLLGRGQPSLGHLIPHLHKWAGEEEGGGVRYHKNS